MQEVKFIGINSEFQRVKLRQIQIASEGPGVPLNGFADLDRGEVNRVRSIRFQEKDDILAPETVCCAALIHPLGPSHFGDVRKATDRPADHAVGAGDDLFVYRKGRSRQDKAQREHPEPDIGAVGGDRA